MPALPAAVLPIVLLAVSNVFMTFAWYGHLRFKEYPLALVQTLGDPTLVLRMSGKG
jgi:uncharacterized protein